MGIMVGGLTPKDIERWDVGNDYHGLQARGWLTDPANFALKPGDHGIDPIKTIEGSMMWNNLMRAAAAAREEKNRKRRESKVGYLGF